MLSCHFLELKFVLRKSLFKNASDSPTRLKAHSPRVIPNMPYSSFANNHKQLLPRQFTCHVLYFLLFLYVNLKMRMNPLSFKVHILADIRQNKTSNETNRKSSRTFDKIRFRLQRSISAPKPRACQTLFSSVLWRTEYG